MRDIEMDVEAHQVTPRRRRRCQLGPTEFRLLRHFLEHPGRVFSRERLLDAVWGTTATSMRAPSTSTSAGFARRSTKTAADMIRTVRSAGYSLDAEG